VGVLHLPRKQRVGCRRYGGGGVATHLAGKLARAHIPRPYVRLEKLPLTRNGEVDRKALPATEEKPLVHNVEAPEGRSNDHTDLGECSKVAACRDGRTTSSSWEDTHCRGCRSLVRFATALGVEVGLMDVFEEPVLRDLRGEWRAPRRSGCQRLRVQSAWDGCRCRSRSSGLFLRRWRE